MLGASIRLGEAVARHQPGAEPAAEPIERGREWDGVMARLDRQQKEMEAIRRQVSQVSRAAETVQVAGEVATQLKRDLERQLGQDLDKRLAAIEAKLYQGMETARQETVNAMLTSVESRVTPRISRLEKDVFHQAEALTELRECAMQSERSIQRLVGLLERTFVQKAATGEEAPKLAVVSR